ncbi:hypothetical protein H0Z60_06605 [Ectothiorhodospiraceae bacterium WFHF3C12]|nr:hypothetical protein [Ectothiorhodospiraceae bacterium WFHF3C12]
MRERLMHEAARIMADEGIKDYLQAKKKAAQHLGAPDTRNMPTNREIQDALVGYQRLFQSDSQPQRLQRLRRLAVEAMEFLERFRPRLVGSVLDGSAGAYSDINLHVFADTSEDVAVFLMEHDIPFETQERRLKFGKDDYANLTVYRFTADGETVDLTVFGESGRKEAPRSRVDGAAMARAKLEDVRGLIEESEDSAAV